MTKLAPYQLSTRTTKLLVTKLMSLYPRVHKYLASKLIDHRKAPIVFTIEWKMIGAFSVHHR
ncbi:hypothetical protein D3C74_497000 [compost metagenome]